jgi:hypothetical protein
MTEVVPSRPRAAAEAEKVRTRVLNQVDEQRNPRTKATVNQRLDRYLAVVELEESTRRTYVGYPDVHVRPMLGALPLIKLNGEVLDTFYAELRRCRVHCDRRGKDVDRRTKAEHECDARCRPHVCRPLAASTVRQTHWILSGAMERAVLGAGSPLARRAARSRPRRPRPGRRRLPRRRRRGCSRKPGRTRRGGRWFGWP